MQTFALVENFCYTIPVSISINEKIYRRKDESKDYWD